MTACEGRQSSPDADDLARRVTTLADRYVDTYFDAFPYQTLVSGAPDRHPDRLVDHSLPALERWQQQEDALLTELKQIDVTALGSRAEAVTYKFLQNQLESAQAFRVCRMELWNVSPTYTGWQADLSVAAGLQATGTDDERRHAVARWTQVGAYLDDEIANLREGLRLGFTAPRHNVQTVIGQMDAMLAAPVADSPFVQMAKADAPASFRAALEQIERDTIRPAIKRYRDFLETTYLPAARTAIGVTANPEGAACYRAAVRQYATVELTPEQIRDMGLEQMRLLESELRGFGARFGTPDPLALLKRVKDDPQYRFKNRAELIAYAEAAVERGRQALPRAFGRIPKAPVIVEPYPPYLEKSAPGGQAVPPTADGKPGKYLINAYQPEEQSRAGLESTAFHETYPGHHLQGAIALERAGLHPISRYFFLSGFGEGWALYAERLSDELGLFSSDVDRIGERSNEALRAARLVVDAGMHALGMTRDEAVDYMLTHTTATRTFAEAEIDRYIAVPGQATAYMIGNLEIRRLRTESERTLGPRFDLRAFHDLVLEDGTMPLWVLRDKVEAWSRRGGPGRAAGGPGL
jgi:uncharacterized protein (DUF885 family)